MRNDIPLAAKSRARAMRRDTTDAERKLWCALRDRRLQTVKFRRQAPIGVYIADFFASSAGSSSKSMARSMRKARADAARDAWLQHEGYRVLRFWNHDVLTARESVLATIAAACGLPW